MFNPKNKTHGVPENVLFEFGREEVKNRITEYKIGTLCIDTAEGILHDSEGEEYSVGIHYGVNGNTKEVRCIPVLVSDVVAFGELGTDRRKCGVARLCYFLTPEEYTYITTEHRPIRITEDDFELAELTEARSWEER